MKSPIRSLKTVIILILSVLFNQANAQEKILEVIRETVNKSDAEKCISFLASDEMRGRGTGTREIDLVADYLAKEYKNGGIKPVNTTLTYFQEVQLVQPHKPVNILFTVEKDTFRYEVDLLMTYRGSLSYSGEIVFVGYGQEKDFKDIDVSGKVVLALTGASDSTTGKTNTVEIQISKQLNAKKGGAVALIELLTLKDVEWSPLSEYLIGRVHWKYPFPMKKDIYLITG